MTDTRTPDRVRATVGCPHCGSAIHRRCVGGTSGKAVEYVHFARWDTYDREVAR